MQSSLSSCCSFSRSSCSAWVVLSSHQGQLDQRRADERGGVPGASQHPNHEFRARNFQARVSNLRIMVYLDLNKPFETPKVPESGHSFCKVKIGNWPCIRAPQRCTRRGADCVCSLIQIFSASKPCCFDILLRKSACKCTHLPVRLCGSHQLGAAKEGRARPLESPR